MLRVTQLDFLEIVDALRPMVEAAVTSDPMLGRLITCDALGAILDGCDDPAHAREPLAQAVYDFIIVRHATILVPQ